MPDKPQVVAVRFGEAELQVQDLPVDTIQRIARRNGISWAVVIDGPSTDLNVAADVLEAAAETLGVRVPEIGTTARDAIDLIRKHFVLVDDTLPDLPVVEGGTENPIGVNWTAG